MSLYKRCMRKDRYPGSVTHVVMIFCYINKRMQFSSPCFSSGSFKHFLVLLLNYSICFLTSFLNVVLKQVEIVKFSSLSQAAVALVDRSLLCVVLPFMCNSSSDGRGTSMGSLRWRNEFLVCWQQAFSDSSSALWLSSSASVLWLMGIQLGNPLQQEFGNFGKDR